MFKNKCGWGGVTWTLVVVGAINWGILGLAALFGKPGVNVVEMLVGNSATLEAIVYTLVGVAGVHMLFGGCSCKKCAI